MKGTNWFVITALLLLFIITFTVGGNGDLFINLVSFVIIFSGTFGATYFSYSSQDIHAAIRVAINSYRREVPTTQMIVATLMDVSVSSRHKGLPALEDAEEQASVSFLKNALSMLVDGYKEAEFTEILVTEMHYFKERRSQHERVFRQMSRFAPAFGVAGSIIGLIGMLSGISEPDIIIKTIPIALTSTLYGILLSNMVLTPIAEHIHSKTHKEILIQKLIIDGMIAIYSERNSYKLEKKLESFLTPSERPGNKRSLQEIKEKYKALWVK